MPKYFCQLASAAGERVGEKRRSAASGIDVILEVCSGKRLAIESVVEPEGVMIALAALTALRIRTWLTVRGRGPEWISGKSKENRSWIVTTKGRR